MTGSSREDEVLQRALALTRPFTIAEVGDGDDYQIASRVLRRLLERGDLRRVTGRQKMPILYEWVND